MNHEKLNFKDKVKGYDDARYYKPTPSKQTMNELYKIASKHAKNREQFNKYWTLAKYYANGGKEKSSYPVVENEIRRYLKGGR